MRLPQQLSPKGRLLFLARDTAVYGVGEALNRGLALITFPLLARHFSVAEFGIIDLLTTCVVLLVVLLVFGQDSASVRYFYETDDPATRRQVISQSFAFEIAVMLMILPPLWIFAGPIADLLGLPTANGALLVRLIILQAPFFVLVNLSQALLKWTFRRWLFLFMAVGTAVCTLAGLAISLLFFELDIVGVFIVYFAVRATFGLLGLWFVREWLAIPADTRQLRQLLPFAVSFGIICVIASAMPVLERWLVGSLVSAEGLGLYAAGAKVAMLLSLAINAIETSWGPFSLAMYREENATRTYNHVLKAVCLLLFSIVLGLAAFSDYIVSLLGSSRYSGAGIVTFPLCFGLAVHAICSVTGVGIVFSKQAHLKLYSYAVLLLVAMVAIPVLASLYGIAGAAWGSAAAFAAKTLVETRLAQRAYPIAWHYRATLILAFLTVGIGIAHQATFGRFELSGVSLIPLVGAAFLVVMGWFVLLDAEERRTVAALIRRRLGRRERSADAG